MYTLFEICIITIILLIRFTIIFSTVLALFCVVDFVVCKIYNKKSIIKRIIKSL